MLSIWCLERSTLPKPIIALPSTSPFDDDAAAESAKEVRTWQKQFGATRLDELFPFCFSFSELCDAQASMNVGAVTSPYAHCPMQVVVTKSEAGQLCLLGLVNLAFVTGHLPVMWKIVPVIPIRKTGKIAGDIAGHRPIFFMGAVFKLLMLYRRIWPAIVSATSPWQGGGTIGADAMAWFPRSFTTGEKLVHMILHSQPLWMGKVLSVGPLRV